MKKVWAILIWGVLVFAIGTYLDMVRGMLMTGSDPMMTAVFRFVVGLGLVVVVVLVGRWLKLWLGRDRLGPGDWFMIGAVAWVAKGGYDWGMDQRATVDIQIHDTLFVLARARAIAAVALTYVLTGVIYYLGRVMNRLMGYVHFFVTHAALYVLLWMTYFNPAYDVKGYLDWHEFQKYQMVSAAYDAMALLLVAAQLLFVVNLFLMLFKRGRRRAVNGRFR
jgi:heme/copper-type cytochrome/quinol oxidase subunit 1